VPDVQGLGLGTDVPGFSSSFVQPKVVDPTVVGTYVKHATVAPPQGSKVIVAWDETGGGNMIASNSLTSSFDINAYLDTVNLGVTGTGKQVEATTYGIGTTDSFFGTPDVTGELLSVDETSNGNTGVGWLFVKEDTLNIKKLYLVDFNDGGDSKPVDPGTPISTAGDWEVLETIDLVGQPSAWHRLGVEYDPVTGDVVARFDERVFEHTIDAGFVGTFYVGFREPAASGVAASAAPALYQLHVEDE
jgi:hypothetical protein